MSLFRLQISLFRLPPKQLNVHFPHFLLSAFLHSNILLISGNLALCPNSPCPHNAGLFSRNAALFPNNAMLSNFTSIITLKKYSFLLKINA